MGQEAARDRLVGRVHAHGHVGGGHHRGVAPGWVVGVRHSAGTRVAHRLPLVGTSRALGQFPFVAEQGLEVAVVPLDGRGRPGAFQAAGDRVHALAAAEAVLPAEALLLDAGAFGFRAALGGIPGAVGLAEGVAAGGERHGFFVVHRHAGEGFADVTCRPQRIGLAIRALGIHVDQAHLHSGQRIGQLAVATVAFIAQPLALAAPVDLLIRLPGVGAPTGEAEGLQAHRVERHRAGQHDQIGPGQIAAVFLLDRPQQPPRLVEVAVVRPAVERRKPLRAGARATAAVGDAVGARGMPGHADEKRPVVAVVGGPPVLRVGHQGMQVLDHRAQVQAVEGRGIVEGLTHRAGQRRVLMQGLQVQPVGPPVCVGPGLGGGAGARPGCKRAACFVGHGHLPLAVGKLRWCGI